MYEPRASVNVNRPTETQRPDANRYSRYGRRPDPGRTWPQIVVRNPRRPAWVIGSMNELNEGLSTPERVTSPLCQPESCGSSLTTKWIRTST